MFCIYFVRLQSSCFYCCWAITNCRYSLCEYTYINVQLRLNLFGSAEILLLNTFSHIVNLAKLNTLIAFFLYLCSVFYKPDACQMASYCKAQKLICCVFCWLALGNKNKETSLKMISSIQYSHFDCKLK